MFYELLSDGTIGMSTESAKIAADLGLTLETDREIVYGYDNKRYFKGEEPQKPAEIIAEENRRAREAYYKEHCDSLTCKKIKNTALGLWTDEDEAVYVEAMRKAVEEAKKLFPEA